MEKINIEGYWRSDSSPYYPMPVPYVLSEDQAQEIYSLIVAKQNEAHRIKFRGFSKSRITGERLGCAEYRLNNWRWPGDFAKHYVLCHKVKPTDAFLDFIGYTKD